LLIYLFIFFQAIFLFLFFLNSFIHMCIYCLGHFSPLPPPPVFADLNNKKKLQGQLPAMNPALGEAGSIDNARLKVRTWVRSLMLPFAMGKASVS
jgi:hypothetical protein